MAHRNSKRLHVHHLLFINQHWNTKRYMNQWNNSYFTCFGGALRQQRGINKKRSSDIPHINIINWFCLCLADCSNKKAWVGIVNNVHVGIRHLTKRKQIPRRNLIVFIPIRTVHEFCFYRCENCTLCNNKQEAHARPSMPSRDDNSFTEVEIKTFIL